LEFSLFPRFGLIFLSSFVPLMGSAAAVGQSDLSVANPVPSVTNTQLSSSEQAEGAGEKKTADVLKRVVVMGASASDGFFLPVKLAGAIEGILKVEHAPVLHLASDKFFMRPREHGSKQLERALAARPTLIVGIDYLFWFGYGHIRTDVGRFALMNWGLEQLEKVTCPIVLSTLPDMRNANAMMLPDASKPSVESLRQLNARIVEWAAERDNVHLVPLQKLNEQWRAKGSVMVNGTDWPGERKLAMLQWDDLHPTLAGLSGLTCHIFGVLTEAGVVDAEAVRLDPSALYDSLFAQQKADLQEKKRERRARSESKGSGSD
jgi:hypothetical protein